MSLPDGVTTCLLTYGPITDTFGNLADSITVEVVADRTIVHAASGRTMFKHPVSVTAEGGGVAQLPVPHTDQAGFRDQQQNSLTGWYYTVTLTARFPGGGIESDRKTFQPLVGQVTRDADLLSSPGMVTPGVTVDGTAVTSVLGLTGEVTEADLAATFASLNEDGELVIDGEPVGGGGSGGLGEIGYFDSGLDQIGPLGLPSTALTSSTQATGFTDIPGCTLLVPLSTKPVWIDVLVASIFATNSTDFLFRLKDDRAAPDGIVGTINVDGPLNKNQPLGALRIRLEPNTPSRTYRLEVASSEGCNLYVRHCVISALEVG